MPYLIVFGLGVTVGGAGGFVAGDGVEGVSRAVKWVAVAGGVYVAARHFKVI